ncbi:MAG: phosphoglucosamine mutase [Bacteroidales bacterium]|nr:phosphoglucosamine mutase [Bacteroidales bacterium]MCF8352084.1 phosphoglucosamine mutase [Bacteroidales bacterium]MCF8375354.1 phosphoglucosamine mutase [Bacteroidales bacterium]MCF8400210.1 phosphoglucosamine mutase [Bacteroidales bacterium]
MTLIKSISGIRGTIGGEAGTNLTPFDILKFTSAFATFIKNRSGKENPTLVIGRDARVSGEMLNNLVCGTLQSIGVNVLDLGLSTTPTVEMAVTDSSSDGGIILTASHNPEQWNALKLLNEKGEFISAAEGADVLDMAEKGLFDFTSYDKLGRYQFDEDYITTHIEHILKLDLVDVEAIRRARLRVAIDCVNSTGGVALPELLENLGVKKVEEIYCEPNGIFPHNPEPLPENVRDICELVKEKKADVGFVVDPDVDRLAIICENGEMFGEEYTLVSVADFVLQHKSGPTVSNLSSTRALRDVTEQAGQKYFASTVGEVNVVEKMKEVGAVIGGEGNGGIIYPDLHYGRDALVGIALFLTYLAKSGMKCSELRQKYPSYQMTKSKIQLDEKLDVDGILVRMKEKYAQHDLNTEDGLKINFEDSWVHLRKSNTEPIIRIYTESKSNEDALNLSNRIKSDIESLK